MKRKFGGLLLALCMALCLLPSAAFAADGVACPPVRPDCFRD